MESHAWSQNTLQTISCRLAGLFIYIFSAESDAEFLTWKTFDVFHVAAHTKLNVKDGFLAMAFFPIFA